MDFVTLGMFIIDEIHFQSSRDSEYNVIGGAGSWAVVGARLFRSPPASRTVGWTVHKGSDFPAGIEEEIESWDTSCNLIETPDRLTTRGWNKYGDDEERAFRYTTEKLRIDETQLSRPLLLSRCFHLICTPARCVNLVRGILAERRKLVAEDPPAGTMPTFVWEPVPDSCGPEQLNDLLAALRYVDVVSPNHQELAALFDEPASAVAKGGIPQSMEAQCLQLLERGFAGKRGAVVVRCGKRGCYIASHDKTTTLPAYYQPATPAQKVVDPTGAGNAFLGGFCVGMQELQPENMTAFERGAVYGSVVASFAVEQVGLPKLTSAAGGGEEYWNVATVQARLESFLERLSGT